MKARRQHMAMRHFFIFMILSVVFYSFYLKKYYLLFIYHYSKKGKIFLNII